MDVTTIATTVSSNLSSANPTNITNADDVEEFGVGIPYPPILNYYYITTGSMYVVFGVVGNLLILFTVCYVKDLRNVNNVFIANLAVSDLLLSGYVMPFLLVDLTTGRYPGPPILCYINAAITQISFPTSILGIAAVAVNRYVKICHPGRHNKLFTWTTSLIMCLACWAVGLFPFFSALAGAAEIIYDKYLHFCFFDRAVNDYLNIASFVAIIGSSFATTCFCYFKIFLEVSRSQSRIQGHSQQIRRTSAEQRRSAQTNFVIFIVFFLFLSPFCVVSTFGINSVIAQGLVTNISFANSCVDWVVYGFMNKTVRNAYRQIYARCRHWNKVNVRVIHVQEAAHEDNARREASRHVLTMV